MWGEIGPSHPSAVGKSREVEVCRLRAVAIHHGKVSIASESFVKTTWGVAMIVGREDILLVSPWLGDAQHSHM